MHIADNGILDFAVIQVHANFVADLELSSLSEDQGGRRGRVVSDSDGFSYPELEGGCQ
jgi:hypothetical protein